jgi:hypothetical protein
MAMGKGYSGGSLVTATTILSQTRQYWVGKGKVEEEPTEHAIVFETLNGVSSVHFVVREEVVTVEINWNTFLGDPSAIGLSEFSKRTQLSAEMMKIFGRLGFENVSDLVDSPSVVMRRVYKPGIKMRDLEALVIFLREYFDEAEKLLNRAKK